METQNQIKRTLGKAQAVAHIRSVLDGDHIMNRTRLADQLCETFEFFDARGRPQRSGCLKALRQMEKSGLIVLPAPLHQHARSTPRRLCEPVPQPRAVPAQAGDVQELQLILVESVDQMRIWNEMLIREHPRGAGPLVGRQLRYLVSSEHGLLGAMGFGAPALQLQDRDRWVGWDVEIRRAHLHRVIALSRFLIRPDVNCHNLASHLLGLIVRQVPGDFERRYGLRPWLVESFVDTSCFSGTCYRAANWIRVGRTQGRGRQDRYRKKAETIKDIYVYPVEKDFRIKLGLPSDSGPGALQATDGLDADTWAQKEFGGAPLGDRRLSSRLVDCVDAMSRKPDLTFSGVAKGDWPAVKGYYRLIDHPDEEAVSMENILLPHRQRTIRRMKGQKSVLCIQDGTDLIYSNLDRCEGLGVIGKNQTGAKSKGLHLHSTLAVTTDGVPLGVLNAQCIAPSLRSKTDNRPYCAIAVEEKESFSWIQGMRDCMEISSDMPQTRLICVMDREADFFELFDQHRQNPCIDLLVRARYNRSTTEQIKLFEAVRQSEVRTRLRIHVKRQSARPKKSKQKARPARPERAAEVSLRYIAVQIRPPAYLKHKAPVALWIVHVIEENPPEGAEAIEWLLLTTVKIESDEDALMCVRWYCLRWRIDIDHYLRLCSRFFLPTPLPSPSCLCAA